MTYRNKTLVISIDVEEWHHSNWFSLGNMGYSISDFQSDLPETIQTLVSLFCENLVSATFFILLESFDRYPNVLDSLLDTNHEIGLHGVEHNGINGLGNIKFKDQITRGKEKLEKISGSDVIGYRAPNMEVTEEALQILAQSKFIYDSSIVPSLKIPGWYGSPNSPLFPYKHFFSSNTIDINNTILEFPIAVFPGLRIPGGGGWFLRNFGYHWVKFTLKTLFKNGDIAVLYIHPWEVSENNPKLRGIPFHVFRHTGNWTLNALTSLIKYFKGVQCKSFKECIEDGLFS